MRCFTGINHQDKLALAPTIIVFQPHSCPHSNFLKQTYEFSSFSRPQYGHDFLHVRRVLPESPLDQMSATFGEPNNARAEVPGIGSPPDQLF